MDTATLTHKISGLNKLQKSRLISIWAEVFSTAPLPTLRRNLMIAILAYRLQERESGGLSLSARKQLSEMAERFRGRKDAASKTEMATGASLIRIWRGRKYEVFCRQDSYEFAGKSYSSLSRIACEITGTTWSGPRFFGLNGRSR